MTRRDQRRLDADADATYAFIAERYATHTFDFEHLSSWLRAHVRSPQPRESERLRRQS